MCRLEERRSRAAPLHSVWANSDAPVLAYMDVDLSTDLAALLPLVAPWSPGTPTSRSAPGLSHPGRASSAAPSARSSPAATTLMLRSTLAARFSDAQCGFGNPALMWRGAAAARRDTGWFFDTELLVLAERAGLRIHEVPVDWVDDPDSRVDIVATAVADLKGVVRLLKAIRVREIPVGAVAAQFGSGPRATAPGSLLRQGFSSPSRDRPAPSPTSCCSLALGVLGAQGANLIALLVTAVVTPRPTAASPSACAVGPEWPATSSRAWWSSASVWP